MSKIKTEVSGKNSFGFIESHSAPHFMRIHLVSKARSTCLTHLSPHSLAPGPCPCPSHTRSYLLFARGSFTVGTVFVFSLLLPFLICSITSTAKFHLALGLFCSHRTQPGRDLQLLPLLSNLCSSSLSPTSIKGSGNLPGQTRAKLLSWEPHYAPFWRRRLPAERLQRLGSICMNKQLWRVRFKLLCKHSPKYVLYVIPSNKDSGIRIWLSVLLMLHGVW